MCKDNIWFTLRVYIFGLLFIILHTSIWIMPNIGAEYTISQYIYNPTVLMNNFKDPMSQYVLAQFLEPLLFSIFHLHKQVYFILLFIFHKLDIHRTGIAFTWIEVYWKAFIKQWLLNWNTILYSIYGIVWIAILNRIKMIWYILPPTFIAFFLTIIANDEIRIALLVLFPSLFYFILKNKDFFNSFSNNEALIYVFVFFISPFLYIWEG